MSYIPVIGLEIHIQPKTASKMFCGCSANIWEAEPNSIVCPVCLGLPGALPVPNEEAIKQCQLMGLVLNCTIASSSKFDRKHYFYPDLPKGYQITQYDEPLCSNGYLALLTGTKVKVRRVHMEEDTGKSFHQNNETLLNFNKSGMPLIEIVTEPNIKSPEEVSDFGKLVRDLARKFNISDCDMEKGQMRLEASISLKKNESDPLPDYRVEIKNINSFKFAKNAVSYEIARQTEILDAGGNISNETRGYNEKTRETFSMRQKEVEKDYRYFPEPDIPLMEFSKEYLNKQVCFLRNKLRHG